jgi:transposase
VSMLDHKLEPKAVRRIEVITGPGSRRRFSDDEKARIIEEALMPGVGCCEAERPDTATAVHLAAAGPAANGVGPG